MKTRRFQFVVGCEGNEALIAMSLGSGKACAYSMSRTLLRSMGEVCRHIRQDYFPVAKGQCGPFAVNVTVALAEPDGVSCTIAFVRDPQSPALLLVDEQVDEFILRATEADHTAEIPF